MLFLTELDDVWLLSDRTVAVLNTNMLEMGAEFMYLPGGPTGNRYRTRLQQSPTSTEQLFVVKHVCLSFFPCLSITSSCSSSFIRHKGNVLFETMKPVSQSHKQRKHNRTCPYR